MMRTPRGRVATRNAWLHFGLDAPKESQATDDLFNEKE
jgi:Holliday junction DNA helicase RuvB